MTITSRTSGEGKLSYLDYEYEGKVEEYRNDPIVMEFKVRVSAEVDPDVLYRLMCMIERTVMAEIVRMI